MFLRKRALDRLAREKVLFERQRGGDILVCVVYPNIYRLGMANLGFQAVYHRARCAVSVGGLCQFLFPEKSAEGVGIFPSLG
jgi:hypothetical protein